MAHSSRRRLPWLILLAIFLVAVAYIVRPTDAIHGRSRAVGHPAPALRLVALHTGTADTPPDLPMTPDAPIAPESRTARSSVPPDSAEPPRLRGRVTLVHFWGTWCAPCRRELPAVADLHARLADHPEFQLLSVSCAAFDDPSLSTLEQRTREFYLATGVDLPTFADPTTNTRRALLGLMQQDAMAYPTTVLIDREGTIRAVWAGIPPGGVDTIADRVEDLLAHND